MDISAFLGRLHPLLVHLPIGFLLLGGIFFWLSKRDKNAALSRALPITFLLGAGSAAAAAIFGWLLSKEGSYDAGTLNWHKYLGLGTLGLSLLAYWWSRGQRKLPVWLMVATLLLLVITGHLGGALTHGESYLSDPLFGEKEEATLALPDAVDSIGLYTHFIQPVLAKKCYACHNDKKQNGGLNMANWEGLMAGGDGGPILAQDAFESELFRRVSLPQSNQKFMPPKGDPFTFGEVNLLKWWLQEGYEPNAKLKSLNATEDIKRLLLQEYDLDINPKPFVETVQLAPIADGVLKELEQEGWKLNKLAQTNELLDVKPQNKTVNESMIKALLQAKEHITWLDLSGSNVQDSDLETLGQLSNLSRLRVDNTEITDAGLVHLSNLQHLASLNLYGNAITDGALEHLKQMPALEKVFLWNTNISESGKQSLQETNNNLAVN